MNLEISNLSNGFTIVMDRMAGLESGTLGVGVGTAFRARILKPDVALGLELIADILTAPTYDAAELERERQVVLQELGQARDTPDDIIFDHLQNVIYQNQPLGWPILGDEQTVTSFTPAALRDYSGRRYRAGGMTLVASGAVSHS